MIVQRTAAEFDALLQEMTRAYRVWHRIQHEVKTEDNATTLERAQNYILELADAIVKTEVVDATA